MGMRLGDYPRFEIPFDFTSYEELSKEEAREFCDWWVAQADKRITALIRFFADDGQDPAVLDFSRESLVTLAKWMKKYAARKTLTPEEIEELNRNRPEWEVKAGLVDTGGLHIKCKTMITDAGFYLAECWQRAVPGVIKWGVGRFKRSLEYNKPVLLFRKEEIMPSSMFNGLFWDALEPDINREPFEDKKLLHIYDLWLKKALALKGGCL